MQTLLESLLKTAAVAVAGAKEFAPGIPADKRKSPIPRVPRFGPPTTYWYVDSKHEAVKSGLHSDLRLSDGKVAYSWAVRKGIPMIPGEKVLAVRQPDHSHAYASFEGQLTSGYGRTKGRGVWIEEQDPARIVYADDEKIRFTLVSAQNPRQYTIIRQGGDSWLLINTTPTPASRPNVPQSKPKYKEADPSEFDKYLTDGSRTAVTAKLDGGHCLPYGAPIETIEHGYLPIGFIVNQKLKVHVKSHDGVSVVIRPVTAWFRRPAVEPLVRVFYEGGHKGSFRVTVNHKVKTPTGEVEAGKLMPGDMVLTFGQAPGKIQTQALLGMLLGDSSIGLGNKGSVLPRIKTTHGIPQEDYCWAKYTMLEELCSRDPREYTVDGYVKGGRRVSFYTDSLRGFGPLFNLMMIDGVKRITKHWLSRLDELSLAMWFMDDGSTNVSNNGARANCQLCVSLHTEGYSGQETDLVVAYLDERWGVRARKTKDGRGHTYVAMGNEASLKFLALVAPFVHPSFEYKMGFKFYKYPAKTKAEFGAKYREWVNAKPIEQVMPVRVRRVEPWTWSDGDRTAGYVYNIEVEQTHCFFVSKVLVANCTINFDKESPEVYSYRPSERQTGLLDHTFLMGLEKTRTPDSLRGIRVRGDLYAVDKDGKAVPNRIVSGLMNSSPQVGRDKALAEDLKLRIGIHDVVTGPKGKSMESAPWGDKLEILKKVVQKLKDDRLHLPQMAVTPEAQKKLFESIRDKTNKTTDEGVVVWRMDQAGAPIKIKFRDHRQVYFHTAYQGSGSLNGTLGSFSYSLTPSGPEVGTVGTGFDDAEREWIWKSRNTLKGRKVVIKSDEQFPSGVYRAPSYDHFHD